LPKGPERLAWLIALGLGVTPLWVCRDIPLVDLPQHLHLISVLHRLNDPTTLYPQVFAARGELTPYLGYYYLVSLLNWLLPLELANRVFLTAVVAGLPVSLGFLLRSLKRPAWPALLAIPFAYGDSLGWGFINYCASIPLALATCGCFVRALTETSRRRFWAGWLAASLVAVLLFHVQAFAFLGLALPFLLVTTRTPGEPWLRARKGALLGVVPGVALFIAWVGLRFGQPQEIVPGQPWKSWGPVLSPQNLAWKSFEQNRDEFLGVLGNLLSDKSDQNAVKFAFILAALGVGAALVKGRENAESTVERWRIVGLLAIALFGYFALPFDIRGYMYYLNTRYAHLAAALVVACVPALKLEQAKQAVWAGVALAAVTAMPLVNGFRAFDAEASGLHALSQHARPAPRVMGLMFAAGSRVVTHPVYLHASTVVARERGGLTNFSFALTPHSPVMYRGAQPPTFPSEWRPDQMRWDEHGRHYDTFLGTGVPPERLFGGLLGSELEVAATAGDFWLVRRR
jgi:hypothetical protein